MRYFVHKIDVKSVNISLQNIVIVFYCPAKLHIAKNSNKTIALGKNPVLLIQHIQLRQQKMNLPVSNSQKQSLKLTCHVSRLVLSADLQTSVIRRRRTYWAGCDGV